MGPIQNGAWWGALLCAVIGASGCGTTHSQFTYRASYTVNVPVKASNCYDAAIVLGAPLPRAQDIAKKVLIAVDSKIQEETATYIRATRKIRPFALLIGSGGEELTVRLEKIDPERTFVTVTTLNMPSATQRPWSCKVVEEMAAMASR